MASSIDILDLEKSQLFTGFGIHHMHAFGRINTHGHGVVR